MPKDYYAVLAVDRDASRDEIRTRFLALARERHPDLFAGTDKQSAEEEFQGITEAFNILFNPEKRRQHDMELLGPSPQPSQAPDQHDLVRVYMVRGVKAYKEKKYLDAADNFDRATKLDDKNAQAWYYLALTCSHNPRWRKQALSAITQACELDRMNAGYHKLAGKIFKAAGMGIRAERYYRQAIQWGGPDAEIESALEELKKG